MGFLSLVWFAVAVAFVHCTFDLTSPRPTPLTLHPPASIPNNKCLEASLPNIKLGESVLFQLRPDTAIGGSVLKKVAIVAGGTVVAGDIDEGGSFVLSCVNNTILAHIQLHGDTADTYELRPLDPARHFYVTRKSVTTTRMDEQPSLTAHSHEIGGSGAQRRALLASRGPLATMPSHNSLVSVSDGPSDTNGILDVMFVFTPQAYENIGGTQSAMVAFVALTIQLSNDAFSNTKSPLRMRAVSIALSTDAAYVEQGFEHELVCLKDQNDGIFDTDTAARTTVGADSVVLFLASSSYCGLAYQWATMDTAFAVVSTQCPGSVAHEVGHNIGLDHDRQSLQDFNYSVGHFNFGYCWDTSSTTCSRSVMAYAGCVTSSKRSNCHSAPYFSSPDITNGALRRATGLVTSDNARVLRDQAQRATNWMPSTTPGGLIFSVEPNSIDINRCEPVLISGWRLVDNRGVGNEDEIVSVTLASVEVRRILSQDANSVEVLTQHADRPGTGDVVVTTRSGYTTTLQGAFAVLQTSGNFTMDFDGAEGLAAYAAGNGTSAGSGREIGSDLLWESTGMLPWSVLRFCDAMPCDSEAAGRAELHGPLVGHGNGGNFAKLTAYDAPTSADYGAFTVLFNSDPRRGCTDLVYSVSLFYHMYTPHSECRGALSIDVLSGKGVWTAVTTALVYQAKQSDPWLPLQYTFPEPAGVRGVRISAVPCSAQDVCFSWSSVSIDVVTLRKTSECTEDGCSFISAYPTATPTRKPTYRPTRGRPTSSPTIATPTPSPSPRPTSAYVPAVEHVRFQCTQSLANVSAHAFEVDSDAAANYLETVAAVTQLPASSLCCLAPRAASPASLTSDVTFITFTLELLVPQHLAIWPRPSSSSQVSPEGMVLVNRTHRLLIDSVASGRFLSSLTAFMGESFPDAAVLPMTEASFTAPESTLTFESNSTVTPIALNDLLFADSDVLKWSAVVVGVAALFVAVAIWTSGQAPMPLLLSQHQTSTAKYRIQTDLGAVAEEEGPDSPTLTVSMTDTGNGGVVHEKGPLSRDCSDMGNFLASERESLSAPVLHSEEGLFGARSGAETRNFIPDMVGALGSFPSRGRFSLNSPSGDQYRRVAEHVEAASGDGSGAWESSVVALDVGKARTVRPTYHDLAAIGSWHPAPRRGAVMCGPRAATPATPTPIPRPPPLRASRMNGSFFVGEGSAGTYAQVHPPWLPARQDAAAVSRVGQRSMQQHSLSDFGDRWIELSSSRASAAAAGTADNNAAATSHQDATAQATGPRRTICTQDSPQNSALRPVHPGALHPAPLPLAIDILLPPRSASIRSAASNFAADSSRQGLAAPVLKPPHADTGTLFQDAAVNLLRSNTDRPQHLHYESIAEGYFPEPHRTTAALLPPPLPTYGLSPRHLSVSSQSGAPGRVAVSDGSGSISPSELPPSPAAHNLYLSAADDEEYGL